MAIITVLAACSSTPPQPPPESDPEEVAEVEVWTGTSTSSFPGTLSLRLELERDDTGTQLTGNYLAHVSPGKFSGNLSGTDLTATLEADSDCRFSLSGTMTATRLDAEFEADDCPDGSSGTWELERTE